MSAEAAYNSTVNITAQPAISLTNEACTDSGDHTTYTISNSAKRYLDINTAVVVQKQTHGTGPFNTVTNYTLKHVGGIITFNTANNSDDVVRISSGAYYAYSALASAHSAEFAAKVNALDVTAFNSNGTETYIGGLMGGTLKSSDWWVDNTRITSLTNRDLLVVSFQTASGRRFEGYVYGTDCGIKSDVKSAVGEDITFQLTNEFFNN
jgi:hypothetical protein